jgi:putative ABC transport system permease protein
MALETLRANPLRSALTILGVVIGITAIVGMTSLIRGFDQSLRDQVRALGPNTIFIAKVSIVSLSSGIEFSEVLRRPNLTVDDARAIERLAPSIDVVDVMLGTGITQVQERMYYRGERTKLLLIIGATDQFARANFATIALGRFFTEPEVNHRRRVAVLGDTAYQGLFGRAGIDPVGKKVRIGAVEYTVIGVMAKRPSAGGFGGDQDDLVVIPQTTHEVAFATDASRRRGPPGQNSATIMVVPYAGADREQALAEVEEIMRIRHGLKLDEPNDFDLATQDAILRVWDQISSATFLALVVISSIALMVGGIGVMAIMMISVTERTREIGVRKALGARRREILLQFLLEAAVLTSIGGILGIVGGSGIGLSVTLITGFPVSLPWWSFAIGLGFSAGVGIFFGMVPAVRASRLDPIEALRHE